MQRGFGPRTLTAASMCTRSRDVVNTTYRPSPRRSLIPDKEKAGGDPTDNGTSHIDIDAVLARHSREWSDAELSESHEKHAVFGWGLNTPMAHQSALRIARAEGVFLYDHNGKRYFDMNAGGMCVNMGHQIDPHTMELITDQLNNLTYSWPDNTITPIRSRLSSLLSYVMPGDLDHFMYPSSGAEANEAIIRISRVVTGREKILSCYRSYHGGAHGHVHFHHAYPYSFTRFSRDSLTPVTPKDIADGALAALREQILVEGPHTIAAIVHEGVTGTNGTMTHPPGYLEGVRAMCDEFGIMMAIDEVMSGWGRTGKLFGFQHSDGVIPDLVASAKGLNSALIPLGLCAMRSHVAAKLAENPVAIGSTYNGHPVALASAYGTIQQFLKKDILSNVQEQSLVVQDCMEELAEKHPSIKQARTVGLLGSLDIQRNTEGEFISQVWQPPSPKMLEFRSDLINRGVWTLVKGHSVYCVPPLVIKSAEVREMFSLVDESLHILDEAMED